GFSVSVGVLRDGGAYAGAVYDPVADQLFTGHEGGGARCNERPLRVSPTVLTSRSLFTIRSPFRDTVPDAVAGSLPPDPPRAVGSTALHLCYVALGAVAFVHDHDASLWDLAGAAPVILEAGGMLTTPDGAALFPVDLGARADRRMAFVAGNPAAHAQAL